MFCDYAQTIIRHQSWIRELVIRKCLFAIEINELWHICTTTANAAVVG